jgi:hypothetical protein
MGSGGVFDNLKFPAGRWAAFGVAVLYFLAKVGLAVTWLLNVEGADRYEPAIGMLDIGLGILMVIAGAGLRQAGEFERLTQRLARLISREHEATRATVRSVGDDIKGECNDRLSNGIVS